MASSDSLRAGCAQVQQRLDDLHVRCEAFLSDIEILDFYVTNCMALTLVLKLEFVALHMYERRRLLQEVHGGQGEVAVFMSPDQAMILHWVEDTELIADRDRFTRYGWAVMTWAEAVWLVVQRIEDVRSGEWLSALEFLHAYENASGLDTEKRLHMGGWPW